MNNIKIKTERLLLRPLTVADADDVFEWVSDERVSRYNLRYDCWGNGYATEAVKAMIEYVRKNFGATHFASSHAEPNLASGHVMEKCGLHFVGYGEFQKLDGSCKMKSMRYEGEGVYDEKSR